MKDSEINKDLDNSSINLVRSDEYFMEIRPIAETAYFKQAVCVDFTPVLNKYRKVKA